MSLPPIEDYNEHQAPPEPPVGTWVMDRFGAVDIRIEGGWAPAPTGFYPSGKWPDMWAARGPYIECSAWGLTERGERAKERLRRAERAAYQRVHDAQQEIQDAIREYGEAVEALQAMEEEVKTHERSA